MSPWPTLPEDVPLETEELERWSREDVPARALAQHEGRDRFVFYEGPPTANGRPAIHHVFARTLKDVVCRHRHMRGFHVPRKAGWDTQGLPVEIEVQKQLGITTRDEIERIGIAEFNRRCRESVWTYKADWEELSRRMGYWLDYDHPYVTYERGYIESCFAILARMHAAGLLERDFKVLPFCPRCSTGLSNHEVAQGYETVQDPSVFVRFGVDADAARAVLPEVGGRPLSLLVWTTTPWTLLSNVAVAASPDLDYAVVAHGDEALVLARARVGAVLGGASSASQASPRSPASSASSPGAGPHVEVLGVVPGSALEGLAYRRPFDDVPLEGGPPALTVRLADFVSADDGTGLVHSAPAFGVDDFGMRVREGLPLLQPVDDQGRFTGLVPWLAGRFVKDADKDVIEALKERGLLLRRATIDHSYPHCWRCRSPLLYMARPSWYVRTTRLRDAMVRLNDTIEWHPPEIGRGRFGEWLAGNVDWAISRERYWGTPLNVWICEACDAERAPASLDELGVDADFDPHRPQIDEVTLPCEACGGTMRRTPEVVDCWFDSGAMPFAQAGWPRETDGAMPVDFPADFIAEGLDQTRGWFYTLHAIATFLTDGASPAYRRCLVANMLLDAQGKKMSKSRGNVVDPWALFDEVGADAARWSFLTSGQVWLPKRFDRKVVADAARRTFGTLRNCYAFLAMYADLDGWSPGDPAPAPSERPSIDRWLLSRLESLARRVGDAYEAIALTEAATRLDRFIDVELSNWYVRRNRSRFWKSGDDADKRAAFATLAAALERCALLMAPVTPFLSDRLWRAVTGAHAPDSVHLQAWPEPDEARRDPALEEQMDVVLAAVVLGRSVRAGHDLRTRQPLARCLVKASRPEDAAHLRRDDLRRLVADELNVRSVEVVDRADFRELSAKPNFKALGPRLGPRVKALAQVVAGLDESALEAYAADRRLRVEVDGEAVELGDGDLVLTETGREGYAVAGDGRLVLALDTTLDDELVREGLAREVVNRVQATRKAAGLDVSDRIELTLDGDPALLEAARAHEALVLREVLGASLTLGGAADGAVEHDIDGRVLRVAVRRLGAASGSPR